MLFRAYEHGGDVEEIRAATNSEVRDEAIAAIERDGGAESGYPDLLTVYFVTDNPVLTVVFQTLEVMQMVEG